MPVTSLSPFMMIHKRLPMHLSTSSEGDTRAPQPQPHHTDHSDHQRTQRETSVSDRTERGEEKSAQLQPRNATRQMVQRRSRMQMREPRRLGRVERAADQLGLELLLLRLLWRRVRFLKRAGALCRPAFLMGRHALLRVTHCSLLPPHEGWRRDRDRPIVAFSLSLVATSGSAAGALQASGPCASV